MSSSYINAQASPPLFRLVPSSHSRITFQNDLIESDSINILNQANIYNGSGVGIGDFNNDGKPDIFLAGNMVENRLYLNSGKLQFKDVTQASGITNANRWCTGVSVVDINNDGNLDIYVCASFRKNPIQRTNLLYVNQGVDKNGIPIFKEMASSYGLNDSGFSTQAYFFDYDNDGDLDMYLVTNELYDDKTPIRFRPKLTNGSANNTDRLYRNNANQHFIDVSKEAGITIEGWGHAASIVDINDDGWPDIYVANDFVSNDLLYINDQHGGFTNQLDSYFKHTGWNAMGTDFADLNNDGLPDMISLEMLPEDNLRKKRMLAGNEYYNYYNSNRFGYSHQYVRNVVQINKGRTSSGTTAFSDLSYQFDMHATDWSWCPLLADFDNDGWKDVIITNGLPRDVTDLDYITFKSKGQAKQQQFPLSKTYDLPVVKVANYAFRNTHDLGFVSTAKEWGLTHPGFSTGAAYADLDNDGDLDIVINNLNGPVFLYENTLAEKNTFIRLQFEGPEQNPGGIGTTIQFFMEGQKKQLYYHQPARGYLSSVEQIAHFAIQDNNLLDSILIKWPNGNCQTLIKIETNKITTIRYNNAKPCDRQVLKSATLLKPIQNQINFLHKERDAIDYNFQASLPHKLSQFGPSVAVGDIDGDQLDDLVIGASPGYANSVFIQKNDHQFVLDTISLAAASRHQGEDMGLLLFDADNDGDNDLYVVSGSYELAPGAPGSQDILYINNGTGVFEARPSALPTMLINGSCVRAADFDGDGLLDLFVGGRSVSSSYPSAPKSYILKNFGGSFIDVTQKYCPALSSAGMVTDALWTDFDNDGKLDLVVTAEWMPLQFFKQDTGGFTNITSTTGIAEYTGWWNSIVAGDFDNDGDIDYVAGNLGANSNYKASMKHPMWLCYGDFDDNGLIDPIVFCYSKGANEKSDWYPMTSRDDLISQWLAIRKRFPTYTAYGLATMDSIFTFDERNKMSKLKATHLLTSYFRNDGNGKFSIHPLNSEAQEGPVYGMAAEDVNHDGFLDLILVGNDYGMEPYSGRHDAFNGLVLIGAGDTTFTPISVEQSDFYIPGDAKGLATVHVGNTFTWLLATQNQDSLLVHQLPYVPKTKYFHALPKDAYVVFEFAEGGERKAELYYGSTFLSQSTRVVTIPPYVTLARVTNFKGETRMIKPSELPE